MSRKLVATAAALAMFAGSVEAAQLPYVTWDPTNGTGVLNALINSINSLITPGSMGSLITGRNALDNGDMLINQRAQTATCGTTTTSGMTAGKAYNADNGNLAFLEVITGTSTNEGFGLRGAVGMATSTGQTAGSACQLTGQTLSTTAAISWTADF